MPDLNAFTNALKTKTELKSNDPMTPKPEMEPVSAPEHVTKIPISQVKRKRKIPVHQVKQKRNAALNFKVTPDVKRRLDQLKDQHNMSYADIVTFWVDLYTDPSDNK